MFDDYGRIFRLLLDDVLGEVHLGLDFGCGWSALRGLHMDLRRVTTHLEIIIIGFKI